MVESRGGNMGQPTANLKKPRMNRDIESVGLQKLDLYSPQLARARGRLSHDPHIYKKKKKKKLALACVGHFRSKLLYEHSKFLYE